MTDELQKNLTSELMECVHFAAVKHRDGRRKNAAQTPYINHPIGVAHILTNEAKVTDPAIVKAAILHDTIEDTDTTFEELVLHFGEKVAGIVAEVTDDKNLPKLERKMLQIQNAPKLTEEAKLVRLADKLYNLRDLDQELPVGWSEERRKEYFRWAKKVVDSVRGSNETLESRLDELFSRNNCAP